MNKRNLLNPLPQADIEMMNERTPRQNRLTYKRKHYLPEGKPRYDDQVDNGQGEELTQVNTHKEQ